MNRLHSFSCDNLKPLGINEKKSHYLSVPSDLQYSHHQTVFYKDKYSSIHIQSQYLKNIDSDASSIKQYNSFRRQLGQRRQGFVLGKNHKVRVNIKPEEYNNLANQIQKSSLTITTNAIDDNKNINVGKSENEIRNNVLQSTFLQKDKKPGTFVNSINHQVIRPQLSWSPTSVQNKSSLNRRPYNSQIHHVPKLSRSIKVKKWIEGKYDSLALAEDQPNSGNLTSSENKVSINKNNFKLNNEDQVIITINDENIQNNEKIQYDSSRYHFKQSFRKRSEKRRHERIIKADSLISDESNSKINDNKNVNEYNFDNDSFVSWSNESHEQFYQRRMTALRDKLNAKGQPSQLLDYLEEHRFNEALQIATDGHSRVKIDTCLLWASLRGHSELVKLFLINGASAEARDAEGFSAIHLAATSGSEKSVEVLISEGAKICGPASWDNRGEYTPLMLSAKHAFPDIILLLLQNGAEIDAGLHIISVTALHYAVRSGSVDCVQLLIKASATINPLKLYSETPLHIAVEEGLSDVVEVLLKAGADVHARRGQSKTSCLHISAQGNYYHITHQLLKAGADSNQEDSKGRTALHLAAKSQCFDTVQILLNYKANPNAVDCDGKTPLHTGIFKGSRNFECLKLLLEAKGDPNMPDNAGYTPLHLAALNDSPYCVKLFLKHGGDLTKKTKGGVTAMNIILRRTPGVVTHIQESLNNAISYIDHDQQFERDGQVQLDFHILMAGSSGGPECRLLSSFIQEGQKTFLRHPLCETFLYLKWLRVRSFFVFNLVFYMLLVGALTQYFYMIFSDTPNYYNEQSKKRNITSFLSLSTKSINSSITDIMLEFFVNMRYEDDCLYFSPKFEEFRSALLYIIWLMLIVLILKEGFQVLDSPRSYLSSLDNIMVWPVILGSLIITVSLFHYQMVCPWQYHLAALVTLFSWFELLLLIGRFPAFGLYVHMFAQVTKNFSKFIFTYLCLINAFSTSFGILFHNQPPFKHRLVRFLKTLVMMTGEIEYNEWFYESKHKERILYIGTAHFVFALFLLFGTIILMNLLVGLAVSDIQGLQKSAGLDRLVRQTELIAHFETFMFSRWLKYLIPSKFLKLLHNRMLLLNSMYGSRFILNPKTFSTTKIPPLLIESIKRIARNRDHFSRRKNAFSDFRTLSNCVQLSGDIEGDISRGIDALRSGLEVLIWETEDQHEEIETIGDKINSLTSLVQELILTNKTRITDHRHSISDRESHFISCKSAIDNSRSCMTNISSSIP